MSLFLGFAKTLELTWLFSTIYGPKNIDKKSICLSQSADCISKNPATAFHF